MLGTIVNCITIIIGSLIGLIFRKSLPERIGNTVMQGLALCVMYIGISGVFEGNNILISIISITIGGIIGELFDFDGKLNMLGVKIENKFKRNDSKSSISEGFVAASLLFCVGAMAIVGSIQSGMTGEHQTLFAKSLMDGISSIILTSSMGIGVMLSSVFVLFYQGIITVCSEFMTVLLTDAVISEMTASGSLLIIGLSLNMLGITKLKIMNYIPAVFIPIILCRFM